MYGVLSTEQSVCQSEYFRAKCSGIDEVLMVTSALYGRMHISKCVKENFGFIGCSTDVLELVDAQCSGRRECSMRILDENFGNAKPCHDDLKTYLQVNYRCVKGKVASYVESFAGNLLDWSTGMHGNGNSHGNGILGIPWASE